MHSNTGKKSTITAAKIKELGVIVNPRKLTYVQKGDSKGSITIRFQKEKISASIALKAVNGDEQALFYAGAGIRNFIAKYGRKPAKKERDKIIKRALHTEKNKDSWYHPESYRGSAAKNYAKTEELIVDHDRLIDLKIPITNAVQETASDNPSKKRKSWAKEAIKKYDLDFSPSGLTLFKNKKATALRVYAKISKEETIQVYLAKKLTNGNIKYLLMVGDRIRTYMNNYKKKPSKETIHQIVDNLGIDYPEFNNNSTKASPLKSKKKMKIEKAVDPAIVGYLEEFDFEQVSPNFLYWRDNKKTSSLILDYHPSNGIRIKKTFSNKIFDGDNRQLLRFGLQLRDYVIESQNLPDAVSLKELEEYIKTTSPKAFAVQLQTAKETIAQNEQSASKEQPAISIEEQPEKKEGWFKRLFKNIF